MVTPLGCGVETTWKRLIKGECGIRAITPEDLKMSAFDETTRSHTFDQLSSKVGAFVPCGTNPGEFDDQIWLNSKVTLLLMINIRLFLLLKACALVDSRIKTKA